MAGSLWTALRLLTSRRPGPLTSAAGASWGRGGSLRATFTTRGGRSWRRADPSNAPEVLAAALASCSPRRAPRADATVLSGGARRPATARLLVTAGPHKGAEFRIVEPLTTLGRAGTNGIVIPDICSSREQLAVEKK